jgi:hypothetical protein
MKSNLQVVSSINGFHLTILYNIIYKILTKILSAPQNYSSSCNLSPLEQFFRTFLLFKKLPTLYQTCTVKKYRKILSWILRGLLIALIKFYRKYLNHSSNSFLDVTCYGGLTATILVNQNSLRSKFPIYLFN